MQLSVWDLTNEKKDFDNFESEWLPIPEEENSRISKVHFCKRKLRVMKEPNIKKKKVFYVVVREDFYDYYEDSFEDRVEFEKLDDAKSHFEDLKNWVELQKQNIFFDDRYCFRFRVNGDKFEFLYKVIFWKDKWQRLDELKNDLE
jgi:hypothetical protein